ncbi:phosphopantetheine-binding protein [Actinokineospora bangkokensis]|uniref:Phosphopantetheine-binding protein n=1 Tax=Actinokineospora bangkokensis TaxID=1193682 RepID=A0A1Q9LS45_9PSEU|nr:phosphopantetheine-binding protein [Actinokineospora bangkokensis]OLR94821.1 phosphopantetheine-binding protein [Actinokineospora bangkokensis]
MGRVEADGVRRVVHEVIGEVLPDVAVDGISGSQHLRDLGADSVERVEIIMAVRARLGVREPLGSFAALPDLDRLVEFLCAVRPA